MCIAVSIDRKGLVTRFGKFRGFWIFIVDRGTKTIDNMRLATAPYQYRTRAPEWLRSLGVDLVIARGFEQQDRDLLPRLGIDSALCAASTRPWAAVDSYLTGDLKANGQIPSH